MTTPEFFDAAGRRLYGVVHRPRQGSPRRAVVLCPPIAHEYLLSHRIYRRSAQLMAEAGLAVLRFDPTGVGDSDGDLSNATPDDWTEDTVMAVEHLRRSTSLTAWGLFGASLGGTVAMRATAELGDAGRLAVWEPVIDGRVYLEDLAAQHRRAMRESHILEGEPEPGELLGYRLGGRLRASLTSIDQEALVVSNVEILLLENEADRYEQLADAVQRRGGQVRREVARDPLDLGWIPDIGLASIPDRTLRRLTAWMAEP